MANIIEVPDSTESIHAIGDFIMEYDARQNAFLNALVNRIARVIVTSKMWNNPWAVFKQGTLELGETVEEIFVNIGKVYSFDPADAENTLYKREIPDVRAAFHTMNFQKFYPVTVSEEQLRQAFLSWSGITDLIARIVDTLYTAMRYDEYCVMKYMLAREILNGGLYVEAISALSTEQSYKDLVALEVENAANLEILGTQYNRAHVYNHTPMADQYLILSNKGFAKQNVEVLAAAFNMDKAEFIGHIVKVDGFDKHDKTRLDMLFAGDTKYAYFTNAELQKLAKIGGVQMDKGWWMQWDNMEQTTQTYNSKGLYWNYFLHTWKTFSVSPYANAIVYYQDTSAITGVTVTPSTATVTKGSSFQLSATVAGTGLIDKTVTWSITTAGVNTATRVDPQSGLLYIAPGETKTSIVVKATAVDGTHSGNATITVSAS